MKLSLKEMNNKTAQNVCQKPTTTPFLKEAMNITIHRYTQLDIPQIIKYKGINNTF